MIDKNGIYSKNHISNFVRDGNRYIKKVDRAEMPHSIDPALRCERHDRHYVMPGFRDINNKKLLDPLEQEDINMRRQFLHMLDDQRSHTVLDDRTTIIGGNASARD